jgi:hypothetical protein
MKAYGGVDVYIHIFLTLALVGGERSASRPGRFTPGETAPCTYWIGVWAGPRTGLVAVKKRKIAHVRNRIPGVQPVTIQTELSGLLLPAVPSRFDDDVNSFGYCRY